MRLLIAHFVFFAQTLPLFAARVLHANPCNGSEPLKNDHRVDVICKLPHKPCPNGYYCQSKRCCPILTTTSTPTTCIASPPSCPHGVVLDVPWGCPACYPNPCVCGRPYIQLDGLAKLCDGQNSCPIHYTCTPTDLDQNVCCSPCETTVPTSTTLCPPLDDCTGVIVGGIEPCPVCLYYDTCLQVHCPDDYYCLVEDTNINNEVASCVLNPCGYFTPQENESGITTLCTTDESKCQEGFVCTSVPNDDEERRVCCPSSSTIESTPSSTTI